MMIIRFDEDSRGRRWRSSDDSHIIMTMAKTRRIPAGRFKAECLALMDHVAETGEPCVVTKHGRPVVRIVPFDDIETVPLHGSVKTLGDIVGPILDSWEAAG